jgi:hypothetical protein
MATICFMDIFRYLIIALPGYPGDTSTEVRTWDVKSFEYNRLDNGKCHFL